MAVRSVYVAAPQIDANRIFIEGDEHRHLSVTRIEPGETVEVVDGRGGIWTTAVVAASKRQTVLRVIEQRHVPPDPLELTLALAIIRPAAFELALEKAVEIGVTRIIPFMADRSNAEPGNRRKRWERILVEAAKQAKQYHLPELAPCCAFDQVLSIPAASKIMFAERDGGPLHSALAGPPVLCLVGPEGGWVEREISAARDSGFHAVSLGAAILKAETAAIVGISLVRYELELCRRSCNM